MGVKFEENSTISLDSNVLKCGLFFSCGQVPS